MSEKKKLNKEQLEAIKHKDGPLLIIAGAGTGKTTVITERIKNLIEKKLASPSEILALTFTEKAAREMETRVDEALPYGYTQMWISTFHSFCDRVLRREALQIGLDPKYKLMTQSETIQFVRNNLFKFNLDYFRPLGNPTKFVAGMIQHFSRLQDEDISPSDYVRWTKEQKTKNKQHSEERKIEIEKWQELAGAYKSYDELKTKEGVMDFGDVIVKTLKLFRDRKNVLIQYQKQFKYILVDEFQDTNISQNELVILLAGKKQNITVVLDDDQSIYRFRGAAVSNALYFRKNFPKAKIVTLVKNYRSTQTILDRAYDLIQFNNPDRLEVVENIDKRLISMSKSREDEQAVTFIHQDRVENEAEAVAKEIVNLSTDNKKYGAKYENKDVSILVRANNHAEPFMRAFSRYGIPFQFLGPGRLFKQPEIVDLIAYLKVLYDFEDSVSMYRLLNLEHFDIEAKDVIRISNFAKRINLSLFEACEKVVLEAENIRVSDDTKRKVEKLIGIVGKHQKVMKKESAGQILYYFLEETGLLKKLLDTTDAESEKKAKNVAKFFDKLKTYEADHEDASVFVVVDWINLASERGESPLAGDTDWSDINAVNILTVHSSKGLEFPVVFLVNLVGQRFPTNERSEQIPIPESLIKEVLPKGDYHTQEERRLFYVGMTRAKEKLYFTGADYYGEGKREKKLSPFIFEALGDKAVSSEKLRVNSEQLSFLDYKPFSQLPIARSQPPLHIDYLSYSQIETFRTCPLHYKLKYVLRLPTPPTPALSFGISMHVALKEFYESVFRGEKPTEKLILKNLDEVWMKEGYKSKKHEEKSLKAAKNYLVDYLGKEFDPKNLPVALEKSFVVPLHTLSAKHQLPLKIGGKIDRVDLWKKGENGEIEIIDYKTGANIPTQKQIDHNLQLTFYALAATSVKEKPFNRQPKEIKLSLYYFDGQQKITTTRTQKELDEAVETIYNVRKEIEHSDFACSGHMFCENCEYKLFCGEDR
jgi:DNA helicase-2/ATP-dependent DNA helicase PcrA